MTDETIRESVRYMVVVTYNYRNRYVKAALQSIDDRRFYMLLPEHKKGKFMWVTISRDMFKAAHASFKGMSLEMGTERIPLDD